MYTSIIGNLQHDSFDPVNASIEIGRRGMEVIILKTKAFYPKMWIKDSFQEQWKQTEKESPMVWNEMFTWLKNLKVKYRVPLNKLINNFKVFSMNSKKSNVKQYCFT